MDYTDELEQLKKQKERVEKFIQEIKFANLPKDLERAELTKAQEKIDEIEFFENEYSPLEVRA